MSKIHLIWVSGRNQALSGNLLVETHFIGFVTWLYLLLMYGPLVNDKQFLFYSGLRSRSPSDTFHHTVLNMGYLRCVSRHVPRYFTNKRFKQLEQRAGDWLMCTFTYWTEQTRLQGLIKACRACRVMYCSVYKCMDVLLPPGLWKWLQMVQTGFEQQYHWIMFHKTPVN